MITYSYDSIKDRLKVSSMDLLSEVTELNNAIQKLPDKYSEEVDDTFFEFETRVLRRIENEVNDIKWLIRNCEED